MKPLEKCRMITGATFKGDSHGGPQDVTAMVLSTSGNSCLPELESKDLLITRNTTTLEILSKTYIVLSVKRGGILPDPQDCQMFCYSNLCQEQGIKLAKVSVARVSLAYTTHTGQTEKNGSFS